MEKSIIQGQKLKKDKTHTIDNNIKTINKKIDS